jgi:hypothetical protein
MSTEEYKILENAMVFEDTDNWLNESHNTTYEILENRDTLMTKPSGNKYMIKYVVDDDCMCPYYSTGTGFMDAHRKPTHGKCYNCNKRAIRQQYLDKLKS